MSYQQNQTKTADGQSSLTDRLDAERYRWLTKHAYIGECFTDSGTVYEVHNCDRMVPIKGSIDDAIDAAMLATNA